MQTDKAPTEIIIEYLKQHRSLLVPLAEIITLPEINTLPKQEVVSFLQSDDRFYLHAVDTSLDDWIEQSAQPLTQHNVLQDLGIDFGPKVLLKERAPNAFALLTAAATELVVIQTALKQALAHGGAEKPQTLAKINLALQKAEQVQKELVKTIENISKHN